MKKRKRILTIALVMILLACSVGSNGMISAYALEVNQTEKITQTERAGKETAGKKKTESEKESQSTETQNAETGKKSETEIKETETKRQTEAETKKQTEAGQTETETKQQTEAGQTETETKKQTEHTDTESPTADRKNASGVRITSADDERLQALIPDANFRKAVYQSLDEYGWLAGDPENPPVSVQEILETYRGPIDASGKGKAEDEKIKDIRGIGYLKVATTDSKSSIINLEYNNITSLMPLVEFCNKSYYYGGKTYDSNGNEVWRNVNVALGGNPLRYFPRTSADKKLGWMTFRSLMDTTIKVVDEEDLHYYYLREDTEIYEGYLQAGYFRYEGPDGEFVKLAGVLCNGEEVERESDAPSGSGDAGQPGIVFKRTDKGDNKSEDADLHYTNLRKSGQYKIGVGMENIMEVKGTNEDNSYPITDKTSISYSIYPTFTIFDSLKAEGGQAGSIKAHKKDAVTGNALEGAVFELYRKAETGEDELVKENLVTDAEGNTEAVDNLPAGTYYFKEVQAPENYMINPECQMISVGYDVKVAGGVKTLNYESADGRTIKAEAKENGTYVTTEMTEPVDLYLEDGTGGRLDDSSGIVSKVTVNYHSLNGNGDQTEEYENLTEAETALSEHIKNNEITGAVDVNVTCTESAAAASSAVVTVEDIPAVTVKAEKKWLGTDADDVLPKVVYTLSRMGTGGKEEVNTFEIPQGSPVDEYTHVFETDSSGEQLPEYEVTEDGEKLPYVYSIDEKIFPRDAEDERNPEFILGEMGEPVQKEKQISVAITNYKKPAIEIIKVDGSRKEKASGENAKLSGVEFKLEKEDADGNWITVGTSITDKEGKAEFSRLDWGEYRLTETKTIQDYTLLPEPILIQVEEPTEENTANQYVYMIKNSRVYEVPHAGGMGSSWFLWLGILLVSAGGLLGSIKLRLTRKRRKVW